MSVPFDPAAWGLSSGYHDAFGTWTQVPDDTLRALVTAMGGDPDDPSATPPDPWSVWVVRRGETPELMGPVHLVLEDGTERRCEDQLPPDLPLGYHDLHPVEDGRPRDEATTQLVVSPGVAAPTPDGHGWGWAVQLYGLRSHASWGVGDLADLRTFGDWARRHGATTVLVNPLDAVTPIEPREPSPYYPTSRLFRDPVYLRIEEVPGAELADLSDLATAGRALNADPRIDRTAVYRAKIEALQRIWLAAPASGSEPDYLRFCAEGGQELLRFATFCSLAEIHGTGWRRWPTELHDPDGPAVTEHVEQHADRLRFHAWVQWQLDEQLRRAGEAAGLLRDLPVGFDPAGADAWMWQDVTADGVSLGAPPDQLGPQGQNWVLPPFVPWKLRAARYQPLIATLRAAFRHAAGLRIDHVLGLFRQFWVPPGGRPADGAYVRVPSRELLDLVALESHRAGAFVVGEDLGTVEEGVRQELAARAVLRYQVLLFEEDPPERWTELALASATTHDLPTIPGLWSGYDARAQRELGIEPDEAWQRQVRQRIADQAGVDPGASPDEATVGAHRLLARARARLVVAQLEDALGVTERANVPGTTNDQRANWSRALPVPLEELSAHGGVTRTVAAMRSRGR